MKNKKIFFIVIPFIFIVGCIWLFMFLNKKYSYEDENTLYFKKFENEVLRFERVDYSLGQNQLVIVQKSINKGKTFEFVTKEPVTVSMEPKMTFIDENLGFVLSKSNLSKNNNYLGLYVTKDGGKTFENCEINYDNPNIETLTIESAPYYNKEILKLEASIYVVKEDQSCYEDKKLVFESSDKGVTWNLENVNSNKIIVEENSPSHLSSFEIYMARDGITIYKVPSIKEVYYMDGSKKEPLKVYISNTFQTTDDGIKRFTDLLENPETLKDGGTKIYKSEEYNITIVKCNTVDGNKDIFIGNYETKFDSEKMCRK